MDVCVVTYRNGVDRVSAGLRPHDRLWVRDNTEDNIGFARAANELARRGADPLILFVNPDGDPQAGCFDYLEQAMADPGVVAAAASQSTTREPRRSFLAGACLVVRRSAFERVGGFDESLFMYAEDADLSWKLASLGRLVLSDTAIFLHEGSGTFRAHYWMTKNGLVVEWRWGWRAGTWEKFRFGLASIGSRRWSLGLGRIAGIVAFLTWELPVRRARGERFPVDPEHSPVNSLVLGTSD